MIVWDIDDGDLLVWMFDSDPSTDPPDQTISGPFSFRDFPTEVKSEAAWNEVASAWPDLTQREIRILGEAALEKIERR